MDTMAKESAFTMKLEADLRDRFMAEAQAVDRPAAQIIREFMRDFIERRQAERDSQAEFKSAVKAGLAQIEDPDIQTVPHDQIAAKWRDRRAELVKRVRKIR